MSDTTARLGLPTIRAGQAQKETSHNEALAAIDLLLQASVVAVGANAPPASPALGQAWVIGAAPTAAWSGHAQHVAGWTEGGWRFAAPLEGMTLWVIEASVTARFSGGMWTVGELAGNRLRIDGVRVLAPRQPAVADPSGGGVVDVEARAALAAVLARLRTHGLIVS